jgi:hypothetical protein
MKHLRYIVLALALVVTGYLCTAATASKPPAPPGHTTTNPNGPPTGPGNVCPPGQHGEPPGSSNCVPNGNGVGNCDQNQSGDHGNGGNDRGDGKGDGCSGTTSTSSTTTTSTSSTSTVSTATSTVETASQPTTTVGAPPQGSPGQGGTSTTGGSTTPGTTGPQPQPVSGGMLPPAEKRIKARLQRELRKQERERGTGRIDPTPTASGQLPHTGMSLGERALVGILLILLGLGLRRGFAERS